MYSLIKEVKAIKDEINVVYTGLAINNGITWRKAIVSAQKIRSVTFPYFPKSTKSISLNLPKAQYILGVVVRTAKIIETQR